MQAAPVCAHGLKYERHPHLLRNLLSFPLSCSLRHGIQFTLNVNSPLPNAVAILTCSAQFDDCAQDTTAHLSDIEGVFIKDRVTNQYRLQTLFNAY
jgi:hypothetical protein